MFEIFLNSLILYWSGLVVSGFLGFYIILSKRTYFVFKCAIPVIFTFFVLAVGFNYKNLLGFPAHIVPSKKWEYVSHVIQYDNIAVTLRQGNSVRLFGIPNTEENAEKMKSFAEQSQQGKNIVVDFKQEGNNILIRGQSFSVQELYQKD